MPKTITFTDEEFDDLVWALLMHAGECLETAADERLPQARRDAEQRRYDRAGKLFDRLSPLRTKAA